MTALDDFYAARIRVPQMIQRAKNQVVELAIYRDGSIVTPDSATYQLLNDSGQDVVSVSAATIDASKCKYTISAASIPSSTSLSDGWFELWEVVIGGVSFTFQRPAYLCLRPLYPCISDIDLESTYSDLANLLPPSYTDGWQRFIDESWVRILERLRQQGNLPYLITDPQSLRNPHLELCLALIWRNMHSSLGQSNGRYMDLYRESLKSYEFHWKQVSFRYDFDGEGRSSDEDKRTAAYPMITTCSPPRINRFFRRF
tara:strand:- start:4325 stop:5095 length:771 start_codon:yes stop_codon:yes gene_type:complete